MTFFNIFSKQQRNIGDSLSKSENVPPDSHEYSSVLGVGVASRKGRRPTMEDEEVVIDKFAGEPSSLYLGLYDGHGGQESVTQCSISLHQNVEQSLLKLNALPDYIIQEWKSTLGNNAAEGGVPINYQPDMKKNVMSGLPIPEDEDISKASLYSEALRVSYLQTDAQLRRCNVLRSGTTSVSVIIRYVAINNVLKRFIHVANVGDSRAVLCRNGLAYRLTVDHKATLLEEKKRIVNAGGFISNFRVNGVLAISRALGDHLLKEKEVVSAVPHTETIETIAGNEQDTADSSYTTFFNKLKTNTTIAKNTWLVDRSETKFYRGEQKQSFDDSDSSALDKLTIVKESIHELSPPKSMATFYEGDFFVLLACDGIWDVMSDQKAINHILMFFRSYYNNIPFLCERVRLAASPFGGSYDRDSPVLIQLLSNDIKDKYPSMSHLAQQSSTDDSSEVLLGKAIQESILSTHFTEEEAIKIRDTIYAMPVEERNFFLRCAVESLIAYAWANGSTDNLSAMIALL